MLRMIDHRSAGLLALFSGRDARRSEDPDRLGRMMELPFGVNVVGDFSGNSGISVATISGLKALQSAGVPTAAVSVGPLGFELPESALRYRVNLLHLRPGRLGEFFCGNSWAPGRDRYNIGYWAWEMPKLPTRYAGELGFLDEVWVPSAFTAAAIAGSTDIPVVVSHHAVEDWGGLPGPDRARFGFGEGEYVFLTTFDFLSLTARKNPQAAVTAFREAFGEDEGVRLVIKHINSDKRPKDMDALSRAAAAPNVTMLGDVMTRDEMLSLMASCDCYVSLHRAEGFGLTMAEAMMAGKPVIATGYSGNMDFMDESNSYPVRYSLVRLDEDIPPFSRGDIWAEPDVEHAAALMIQLREGPEAGRRKGLRASEDLAARLSADAIGARCRARLEEVAGKGGVREEET